jgi:ABC-2 type transport system permease protein
MTTAALTPVRGTPARSLGRFTDRLADVWSLTRRNLIHVAREPMQLSDVTVQPVLFTLLFIYVFGSGIPIHGGSYKDFALAGLLTLNLTTSTMAPPSA